MPVKLDKLTLATLNIVDPRIEKMFQKHIRQVMEDVNNRPGEAKPRKMTLTFDLTPVIERNRDTGDCYVDTIRVALKAPPAKLPDFTTKGFPMKITANGLFFNKEIPEDLHQPSLIPDETADANAAAGESDDSDDE